MEVICLEDEAFLALVERVADAVKRHHGVIHDKWIAPEEAMHMLNIKSKTTLQNLRDEGKIRYTQPQKKIILYDRDSINSYLESNAKNTF